MWKLFLISYLSITGILNAGGPKGAAYLPRVGPSALRFEQPLPPMVAMNLPPLDMGRNEKKSEEDDIDADSNKARSVAPLPGERAFIGPLLPEEWAAAISKATNPDAVSSSAVPADLHVPVIKPLVEILSRNTYGTNTVITPVIFTPPTLPASRASSATYSSPPPERNTQP